MGITLDEAFIRAAKHFYDGNSFEATEKVKGKPSRYSKSTFDDYEKGLVKRKKSLSAKEVKEGENLTVEGESMNGDS